jgi:O-methyltransferase domain/Dimerisation domain
VANRFAKTPPPAIIRVVTTARGALQRLHRSSAPASVATIEMVLGSWLTQALYAAVRLGIPDELGSGPLTADEVARRVGSDPGATYRLMRLLASNSLLKLRRDGRFELTRLGRTLRRDDPSSVAAMVTMVGSPQHWEHWGAALQSVKTGRPAIEILRGVPTFEYIGSDPEFAEIFNDAMTATSTVAIETAVPAYDFSDRKLIVDVGGGHGALLGAVLAQAPDAHGVLFDLPSVVAGAAVSSRYTAEGGSFFDAVPAGGDAYLMKTVIHDWDDEKSVTILRNIRTAIAPNGKLLLFELVLPEGAPAHLGMLVDLEMLVTAGGKERTAAEYAALLSRAGFRLTRVVGTPGPVSIVEAVPA